MILQEKIQKKAEEFDKFAPMFLEGAKFALDNQWISIDDDLPCNHEELITTDGYYEKETINVITISKTGIIYINYMILCDNKWKWKWKYGSIPCYWMLIPKLPKGQEIEL